MSNISRIKSLMMISEQQKIVAPSVNIDALITMLLFIKDKNPEVIEDIEDFEDVDFYNGVNLSRYISKNLSLFGLPKFDGEIEDFYGNFILNNLLNLLFGIYC